ncbi:hypothetical protein N0V83_006616 [Neocucurbitaria cava]|uniref:Uncharacterized protein n=1 Tax=Neocucurbitaria cava TaxID=798079 RepID=A0A9W8Y5M8_9PLEO|nr:hypothetical protein N0V83_006616 [Neocucurbitaria cava]
MDVDVDDDELSVIEYARSHGICVDYTTESLQIESIPEPSDADYNQQFEDPSNAFVTNVISGLVRDRLTINKDAALLLKAIHSWQDPLTTASIRADGRHRFLGLKQELPILRSDYELDLLTFGKGIVPNLRNLRIPSEVTDEEQDEGFEWPAKYFAYPAQCEAMIRAEKMTVSREALVYLQDAIRDSYVAQDAEKINDESLVHKPNTTILPLTPPLLPISPPLPPYIPSSPANRLPFASDSSDSVARESMALEQQIMAVDSLVRKSSDSSDSMLLDITHPPQISLEDQKSSNLKRSVEDLKVEGPLTPSMFSTSPMKKLKSVSFSATLPELIPNAPWANGSSDVDSNASIDFDEIFKDIEPLAKKVKASVENEQLLGADTTARVGIPNVDFTLPVAPWNEYSQITSGKKRPGRSELDAQMQFLLRTKREDLKTATSWHGLSALERNLRWSIFTTKISSVNLVECLHGEKELERMLNEITTCDVATSSLQVWKREGLRILDDNEDEAELEQAEEEEGGNMETLIRKRKLEMDDEAAEMVRKRTMPPEAANTQLQQSGTILEDQPHKRRPQAPALRSKTQQAPIPSSNGLMFGGFSASTALHKFMATRGKPAAPVDGGQSKRAHPIDASVDTTRALNIGSKQHSPDALVISEGLTATDIRAARKRQQPQRSLPELPSISNSLAPCSFIASSSLLQHRSLTKQIEKLYPGAEIVYRDYSSPFSAVKEADIILSPSTGLAFTTLQQAKQRALPGQPEKSPVKELMTTLQSRYERLVVLISEGLSREMEAFGSSRPDDSRDKAMLSTFETFASRLDGEVIVKYIPGGEQALAHSVVVEMTNYGLPHGSADIGDIKPLAAETNVSDHLEHLASHPVSLIVDQWEIFLRRAGLNAFAAQVLVASLQQPFDVQLPNSSGFPPSSRSPKNISVFGLPGFIMMDEEERVKYFQVLMGGSRILRRISSVLNLEWVSAAHGFRF